MNLIINSNTCIGSELYSKLKIRYSSPLIGTLIPNDYEYLKFTQKFESIINECINITNIPKNNTIFEKQTHNKYYYHKSITIPYPIIQLSEIDIHCIHEKDHCITLEKFKRRLERSINIIKTNNYIILNVLVFTEIINESHDYQEIINDFLNNNNSKTVNIFLGPHKFKIQTDNIKNIYIAHSYFDNISTERDSSHIMKANDQNISRDILYNFIINNIISLKYIIN